MLLERMRQIDGLDFHYIYLGNSQQINEDNGCFEGETPQQAMMLIVQSGFNQVRSIPC